MELNLRVNKRHSDEPSRKTATLATLLEIPDILATVLSSLDTERLKLFRRVCLTWSKEISRILRTRVVPRYSNSAWEEFQDLLNSGKELPRLLCPFQEIYARIRKEELNPNQLRSSFDWLHPPFPLTRLTLLFTQGGGDQAEVITPIPIEELIKIMSAGRLPPARPKYDTDLQKCVWVLLQSCSGTLTHLATPFWNLNEEHIPELGLASLHFPKLRALKAVGLETYQESHEARVVYNLGGEIDFFLRIIGSAPKLTSFELEDLPSAPILLRRVSLKKLEKLVVSMSVQRCTSWSALNNLDAEALKCIRITEKLRTAEDTFLYRYSSSLEYFGIHRGPWEIPGCPFLTHLDFETNHVPVDLSSYPSLRRVTLHGDRLHRGIQPSSTTVLDVDIEDFCVPESSRKEAVLELFKLFPCATHWKINYQSLRGFCQVASGTKSSVEKVGLSLKCFGESPCIRSSSDARVTAETDLEVFSGLYLLQNLCELELHQSLDEHNCSLTEGMKLPYNISAIPFGTLPILRTFRIFAKSHELPADLIALQELDIAAEVIVDPCPTLPNWSDSFLLMSNVTLGVAKTVFP